MSQKNPLHRLPQLKVIVDQDTEGQEARREVEGEIDELRPRKRGDCLPGGRNSQRPCPWYGCKYHLGLDINEDTGSMAVRNIDDMVHTCDLDVAEIGGQPGSGRGTGITLEEAGEIMSLTRERMRQIEFKGMSLIKPILIANGLSPDDWPRCLLKKTKVKSEADTGFQEVQEIPLASDDAED